MVAAQIHNYIQSLPKQKGQDLQQLHALMLNWLPQTTFCFEEGLNSEGKVVSNPIIGYGSYQHQFANGTSKAMFQIGLSANTTGISVYLMGIRNKLNLAERFGNRMGKAKITGYCIKFKTLQEIDLEVLREAILLAMQTSANS